MGALEQAQPLSIKEVDWVADLCFDAVRKAFERFHFDGEREMLDKIKKDRFIEVVSGTLEGALKAITDLERKGGQKSWWDDIYRERFTEVVRRGVASYFDSAPVIESKVEKKTVLQAGYFSGYAPSRLDWQISKVKEIFPRTGSVNVDLLRGIESGEVALPIGAEGWFSIPNLAGNRYTFGSDGCKAFQKVLYNIKKKRKGGMNNWREDQLYQSRLRRSERTTSFLERISEAQGHPDILIVPAQFGFLHRGQSARWIRHNSLGENEFELGLLEVSVMLYAHPKRLGHYEDLQVYCTGDEFVENSIFGDSVSFPFFGFSFGRLEFSTFGSDFFSEHLGSVSAFVVD